MGLRLFISMRTELFFDENREFHIYTPTEILDYEVMAAVTFDDRLIPAYFNEFKTDKDVKDFLTEISGYGENERNHFSDDFEIQAKKHYVVLSTCAANSNTRFLVIGVLKEK